MNKKQIALLIIITAVIVWVADLLVGNYLSARLATSPLARKFNLFNPQAPIVVTNRETVRVDAGNDIVATAENAKSKVATLVYFDAGRMSVAGGLVNWTTDGYFLSSEAAFSAQGRVYAVMTQNGDVYPVTKTYKDPSSKLVIVATGAQGLALLDPADSNDLRVGQQVVLIQNSLGNNQTRFSTSFIKRVPQDLAGVPQDSDAISRNIELTANADAVAGQAVINMSGRLIGLWDGVHVVPIEELKMLMNNFLQYQKNLIRPSYGFTYQIMTPAEAKAVQSISGARVLEVASAKPALLAGLKAGDVITAIDGKKVEAGLNMDSIFRQAKPGQSVRLTAERDGKVMDITVTAGQLK